jgi:hypothetical protein
MPYKLTNNLNLPEPLVQAIANDQYESRGDISVTTLIDAPKQRLLKKFFEYDEDVSSLIYALQGTSVHSMIERAELFMNKGLEEHQKDWISEKKMEVEYNGWKVTGTSDQINISGQHLYDWKITSVWQVLGKEETKIEWVRQTNIYAHWLRTRYGIMITNISIVAIIRDWSKQKAKFDRSYPQQQVVQISIPVESDEKIDAYINRRVILHQNAQNDFREKGIDSVVECTSKERWLKPEIWKVKKGGAASKSIKNFEILAPEDKLKVYDFINQQSESTSTPHERYSIEKQLGESFRCNNYCSVRNFCNFYMSGKSLDK